MICGKILSVNLSAKIFSVIEPDLSVYDNFIGGRGLCGWLFINFSEQNPLIFCTGPLTGTGYQTTARCAVMHKNPMTGGLFRSDFGGKFACALKAAGYDGLIITGRSENPLSLVISDEITFGDAPENYAEVKAGTNRDINFCGILSDNFFTAHRGGTGSLMHSMNLVSVCAKPAEEPEKPDTKAYEDIERLINASPSLTGRLGIGRFGTAAIYDLAHARDILPSRYFGLSKPNAKFNAAALGETESVSCGSCSIACRKAKNGLRIPEYDEFAMLLSIGASFENLTKITDYCAKSGLDIITLCHCIAFYRTHFQHTPAEELIFNMPAEFFKGSAEMGSKLNIKGIELPAFAPDGAMGIALGYAVSPNGADWTTAMALTHEILRKPVPTDRYTAEGKAVINIAYENAKAAADSLPVCRYSLFSVSLEEYAKAADTTSAHLMECGHRIFMNEIEINARLGFDIEDNRLPKGLLSPEKQREFDAELAKYHRIRGLL